MKTPAENIIRSYFAAYERKDRDAIEALLTDDFTFSSPLDDNINREIYFEHCWPNSAHIDTIRIEHLLTGDDVAFVEYELQSTDKPPFRNAELFAFRHNQITHVDVYFGAATELSAAEAEIRELIQARADAIRCRNVDKTTACFAPNAVRFSLAPPLQAGGSFRKELEAWFATFLGEIHCDACALTVETAADLACCHSLCHMSGTKIGGDAVDLWFRETLCLRQIDGQWLICHAHQSVPFYMDGSVKAAVDLKPN